MDLEASQQVMNNKEYPSFWICFLEFTPQPNGSKYPAENVDPVLFPCIFSDIWLVDGKIILRTFLWRYWPPATTRRTPPQGLCHMTKHMLNWHFSKKTSFFEKVRERCPRENKRDSLRKKIEEFCVNGEFCENKTNHGLDYQEQRFGHPGLFGKL